VLQLQTLDLLALYKRKTMSVASPLLQPVTIGGLTLRNRIALAPMTRARSGKSRVPNALMAEYYTQRSSAGLVITEATVIADYANGWNESPGIYTDEMASGWNQVTTAVHQAGGAIFLQLWHCGRASHSSFVGGKLPMAPSAIAINGDYIHTPDGKQPYEVPRAIETAEIAVVVKDYQLAARRAKQAGFDGVEIHGANGYLIDTFLQSKTNHRTDQYGGSKEGRYQFLKEIVEAVIQEYPADRVGVRLSPNGVFNDMGSPDFREQFTYVASQLDQYGLAYLHLMNGLGFGFHGIGEPMTLAEFRAVFKGPLIGNCGYTIEEAEKDIQQGHADMIAIGRPYISNPDFVERVRHDWPLAAPAEMGTWYLPTGAIGYTDFPTYRT
jgi:N-ethylmaleimide reductase